MAILFPLRVEEVPMVQSNSLKSELINFSGYTRELRGWTQKTVLFFV
jgi:hypothetical protein